MMAKIRESGEIKKLRNRLRNYFNNPERKTRKTLTEYKSMKKKDLLNSLMSYIRNYDFLREKYFQLGLENNFLHRRINLLEEQLSFYRKYYLPKKKKSQKRVDSPKKRYQRIKEENEVDE